MSRRADAVAGADRHSAILRMLRAARAAGEDGLGVATIAARLGLRATTAHVYLARLRGRGEVDRRGRVWFLEA